MQGDQCLSVNLPLLVAVESVLQQQLLRLLFLLRVEEGVLLEFEVGMPVDT
jgi:hypothetical protein